MADSLPSDLQEETPEQVRARVAKDGGLPNDLQGDPPAAPPPSTDSAPQPAAPPAPAPEPHPYYDFMRNVGEGLGLVPRGVLPEALPSGKTVRGAMASAMQGFALAPNLMDEVSGLVMNAQTPINDPDALSQIAVRAKSYAAGGMPMADAYERALHDVRGLTGIVYQKNRDAFRGVEGDFREEHPIAAFGLTALAGAGSAPTSLPGAPQLTGVTRYLPAAAVGAAAGAGAAPEMRDVPGMATQGALLGPLAQVTGEGVGAGLELARRGAGALINGVVKPTPAAQYLMGKGVKNLTIGQMAPGSTLAQLEQAASLSGGAGPAVKALRDAGKESWQLATANQTLAPGMAPLPAGTTPHMAQQAIDAAFDGAYAVAKGYDIDPASIQSVVHAVDDPSVYASNSARSTVSKFISDQMSALRLNQNAAVDSGDVIALRSVLREHVRSLESATDGASIQERNLLKGVVDELTNVLDVQLPAQASNTLRVADAQFAKFATLGEAVGKAKDMPEGFTPTHLQNAVEANTPPAMYRQGGGGVLRHMAANGKAALDTTSPINGAITQVLGYNPTAPWTNGFAMLMANRPSPKAFLTGQTALQQSLQGSSWLQSLAQSDPQAFAQWGAYLSQAAARSPEALGMAHYELSQSPEYQEQMKKLGEESSR